MPFTTEIKNEICALNKTKTEYISELSAFVRNNNFDYRKEINLITENPKVARRLFCLFKDLYDINPNIIKDKFINLSKRRCYRIIIKEKLDIILSDLNVFDNNNYLDIPKNYLIESIDDKRAYLRGVFLATGSVSDPKKAKYHLELFIDKIEEANFVSKLLHLFDIDNKILRREKGYMLYVKKAEKIADFLRVIEANNAVLYFEDIRIYRDHKNMTNRLNNCEQANTDKIIESANKQLSDIDKLLKRYAFESLDEKIQEIIVYRRKYPDVSLSELSNIILLETGTVITKSGLNHRFRKIKEMIE